MCTHVKYEGPNSQHLKDMANVKVFVDKQTDNQSDKQMGKKLCAPNLSIRGHKKEKILVTSIYSFFNNISESFLVTWSPAFSPYGIIL